MTALATEPRTTAPSAWIVHFSCWCSDAQPSTASLPLTCPGHGKPRKGLPSRAVPLIGQQLKTGHVCYDQPCPQEA